jgi:hypothetical protein
VQKVEAEEEMVMWLWLLPLKYWRI